MFDCSLKFDGVSLNDKFIQGPDLTNSLIGVLLRFKEYKFAIAADVEKMYFQVSVSRQDRNYMRLLWYDESNKVREFRLTVHVFGAKSSASVANYALNASQ